MTNPSTKTNLNELEDQKRQLEEEIAILERKKSDLLDEILQNRRQDDKVRDNLARWSRELTEQSKALDIREAKIDQITASNHNLMQI